MSGRLTGGKPAQARELRAAGRRNVANLCDAALTIFAERGFHAARVDDICTAADVSHGTFYLYFESKDDLFRTLVDDVVVEMRELAGELPPIGPGLAGRQALRGWVAEFHDLYRRYLPVILAWNEANNSDTDLARMGAQVLRRFVDRLVERIEEHDAVPVGDPRTAAMVMIAMVERASTYGLTGFFPTERDPLLDVMTDILHAGLFSRT